MNSHFFEATIQHTYRAAGRGGMDSETEGFGKHRRQHTWHHIGGGGGGRDPFSPSRERLFDSGDLKLIILKLLSDTPSYGYQLMKTMEKRLSGGYTPSAGVIYPTLTILEEEGFASGDISEANKKIYSVSAQGIEFLKTNKDRVDQIFERMKQLEEGFRRRRSPEIIKAIKNFRDAVHARISRATTPEQLQKIAKAIDAAAEKIDEL